MNKPYQSTQKELNQQVSELIPEYKTAEGDAGKSQTFTFNDLFANKLLLSTVIRRGIPFSFFDLIQRITPFNENDWADLLNISTKSLRRYKDESRHLKPIQTEKVLEMAEVTELGMAVFGDMIKLKRWLDTPNYALGRLKPIELIKDSYGKELVIGELTRINYGILV